MKILKELLPYIIIIAVVVLVRTFVVTPVWVEGTSMVPTLQENDILVLNKMDHKFQRFDIVVIQHKGSRLVKRVIGLPGETVEYRSSKLYINGKHVQEDFISVETGDFTLQELGENKIPKDSYFVVGDNRGNSLDSRMIGLISKKKILGTTSFTLFPFNRFGKIE